MRTDTDISTPASDAAAALLATIRTRAAAAQQYDAAAVRTARKALAEAYSKAGAALDAASDAANTARDALNAASDAYSAARHEHLNASDVYHAASDALDAAN